MAIRPRTAETKKREPGCDQIADEAIAIAERILGRSGGRGSE